MPRDTIRDWVNKNKGTYREYVIKFILSRPAEELEEFLKGEGVEIESFKDERFKVYPIEIM